MAGAGPPRSRATGRTRRTRSIALAADPTSSDAAMRAALVYHYRLGDLATAVERYRTVLAIDPNHYGAHYQVAVALLGTGRKDEALAALRRFVPLADALGDRTSIDGAPPELRTAAR
jgi:tetratricopeptide (TPR) repeat protein